MFESEEKSKILTDCYRDPVLFLQTFLPKHFFLEIPWVHRGMIAVLTEQTDFLLKYGQISKIVKNFRHVYDETASRQIFHVVSTTDSHELTEEEIKKLDSTIADCESAQDWSQVESLGVQILLDLGPFTLIEMPRGSSKTTIAGFGIPLYKICYRLMRFMLYVSNAGVHSQGQVESVRKELSSNSAIVEFFGDLKPSRSDDERWSQSKIETLSGIAMQYRGKGSAVRGVNHNNFRPDIILVDDPQNKDDVRSDIVREEDKRWAFAELTPALEKIQGGKLIALVTYLGPDSLADVWSKDPRFTTIKLEVVDSDGEFIWPAYMDQAKYDVEMESFQRAGLLADFYREYHNREFLDEKQIFKQEFFIYDPDWTDVIVSATYADLATSDKRTADYSCITTVGITAKGIIKILDCWLKRGAREEEKLDEYFRQSLLYSSVLHGFEANGYQAVFGPQLRAEMFRRAQYFEVLPITHKNRKVDRIRGALRPRYSAGYVRHRIKFPLLESQLLDFRIDNSHKHDDGPDAVAAALVLMDPTAAFNAGEDPSETHLEDIEKVVGKDTMDWAS